MRLVDHLERAGRGARDGLCRAGGPPFRGAGANSRAWTRHDHAGQHAAAKAKRPSSDTRGKQTTPPGESEDGAARGVARRSPETSRAATGVRGRGAEWGGVGRAGGGPGAVGLNGRISIIYRRDVPRSRGGAGGSGWRGGAGGTPGTPRGLRPLGPPQPATRPQ